MIGYIVLGGLGLLVLANRSKGQSPQQSAQAGLVVPRFLGPPQPRFIVPVAGPRIDGVQAQIEPGVNAQVTASVPWQPATTIVPTYDGVGEMVSIVQPGRIMPTTAPAITTDLPLAVPILNGAAPVMDQGGEQMTGRLLNSPLLPFGEYLEGPVM